MPEYINLVRIEIKSFATSRNKSVKPYQPVAPWFLLYHIETKVSL